MDVESESTCCKIMMGQRLWYQMAWNRKAWI